MTSEDWKTELTKDIKKIEFALRHPKYMNFKINHRLQLIKLFRKLNELWPYFFTATFIFEYQHALRVTPIIFDILKYNSSLRLNFLRLPLHNGYYTINLKGNHCRKN